ncbi:MAG: DUF4956 domain-containing protein [Bacillota bacterium]|nr:DUF4956 domain-containing protein [Bacillota bacterium]
MDNFFDSIFGDSISAANIFLMVGIALATGIIISLIMSLRLRSSKGFFITCALLPAVVGMIIALVNGYIGTGVGIAIAGAFGLVRFRSAQGKAEEIALLFISAATGFAFGAGYVTYGAIFGILMAGLYDLLTLLPIYNHKYFAREKILKIVIPESLNYTEVFTESFAHYLREHELVAVKTTGMGSMFKLSYRVVMKNQSEEKEMIDELRTKNGNLEISLLPYTDLNDAL